MLDCSLFRRCHFRILLRPLRSGWILRKVFIGGTVALLAAAMLHDSVRALGGSDIGRGSQQRGVDAAYLTAPVPEQFIPVLSSSPLLPSPIDIGWGSIQITRVASVPSILWHNRQLRPERDQWVGIFFTATNTSDRRQTLYGSRFLLRIEGELLPLHGDATGGLGLQEGIRATPAGWLGVDVGSGRTLETVVVFDCPRTDGRIMLRYDGVGTLLSGPVDIAPVSTNTPYPTTIPKPSSPTVAETLSSEAVRATAYAEAFATVTAEAASIATAASEPAGQTPVRTGTSRAGGQAASTPTSFSASTPTGTPTATSTATLAQPTVVAAATYVVQSGDTLSAIAARLGVSVEALASHNNISDPSRIYVGQVIVIPPGATITVTPVRSAGQTPANATSTARAEARYGTATAMAKSNANATATIEAYADFAPEGTWCSANAQRGVCVGDFRYVNSISYTSAPANGRFIAFGIGVKNLAGYDISVNPFHVTLVMEEGSTYAHASESYSYWAQPLDAVTLASGDTTQGGIVFLVRNDVGPSRVIYRGSGLFEAAITVDLREAPTD